MDCLRVPELAYSEFSRNLHEALAQQRVPLSGSVELTARCNLGCAHCYVNLPADDASARDRELTSKEWSGVLGQAADEGCLWLLVTGGEPLLRPDFPDVWVDAKRKGFLLSLFTNGTLVTPRLADLLAEWPPFALEITIYGATQETYERVTGAPGSWARCRRGIDLLLERKLPLKLKTMAMAQNVHELEGMKTLAAGLGVGFRFDAALNARIDGRPGPERQRIPARDAVALDLADEERLGAWREFLERFGGRPPDGDALYNCGAGLGTFHVDAFGKLSVCIMSRSPAYDLRSGSFHEGWTVDCRVERERKRSRPAPCACCDLIALCGQCPGWADLESHDPEEPVAYLCGTARLRAEALRGIGRETGRPGGSVGETTPAESVD